MNILAFHITFTVLIRITGYVLNPQAGKHLLLLVENLFGETPSTEGTLTLEGNTIQYSIEDGVITLIITDENGNVTEIQLPIGDFSF